MTEFDYRVAQAFENPRTPPLAQKVANLLIYPLENNRLGKIPRVDLNVLRQELIEKIVQNFIKDSMIESSLPGQFYSLLGLPTGLAGDSSMIRAALRARGYGVVASEAELKLLVALQGKSVEYLRYERRESEYAIARRAEGLSELDPMIRTNRATVTVVYPYGYIPNPLEERYLRLDFKNSPKLQLDTLKR